MLRQAQHDRREESESASRPVALQFGGGPVMADAPRDLRARPFDAATECRGYTRGNRSPYPPFLPNEANCNVGENVFMWHEENGLRRLQKNDNWLRFFRNRVWRLGDRRSVYVRGRETGAQQENGTTEMVAANNSSVSSDSARQPQHDRREETEAATGPVALQFGDGTAVTDRRYRRESLGRRLALT
jgi:hypothetical protein